MFEIGSAVAKIKADTSEFQQGLSSVGDSTNGLASLMGKLGLAIASAFTVKKIIEFGNELLNQSGKFEQYNIAFETMLGSAEKGKQLFSELKEFAKQTPFNFENLAETTKKLLAYGVVQDDIIPTLRTLGDIASGVGMDKMPQLTLAFGQVKAMGHLTGMELRQFSEAGVPLLQALADKFNVTTGQMQEMISSGNVGFKDVRDALSGMNDEGGKFFNLMEKQSGTYLGKISNLQDSWQQLKATMGEVFLPIATQVIDKITQIVLQFQQWIEKLSGINGTLNTFQTTWATVLAYLQPAIDWFVADVLPKLQSLWAEIWYFINAVVPPLITIFNFLIYQVLIPIITNFVNFWKANWDNISLILKGTWDFIVGLLKWNFGVIAGIFVIFLDLLTFNWSKTWEDIKHYGSLAWEGIKQMFNGIISFLKGWGGWLWDVLTEPFRKAWEEIEKIVNKIKDALDFTKRHSPSVIDVVEKGVGLVNKAFDNLKVGIEPIDTKNLSIGGTGGGNLAVNISLDGAIISDEMGARSMAEKIGDLIIGQLKSNVRF